ncbi:MAG TPA: DUF192 domain-containing protein [Thermoleophilaceae bacterium]|nr:DUF192 domain-containing protein [Thermoleophilaceae bacterium]
MVPTRLLRLEHLSRPDCPWVFVASSARTRLLGLAWLDDLPADCGLLIPGCSSVHTFGMRFALDIDFLDADGRLLRRVPAVPPRRIVWCRGAAAVLERPSATPERRRAARGGSRALRARGPRSR